jgi:hypothetical protein
MRNLRSNLLALGLAVTTALSLATPVFAQDFGPGSGQMMAGGHSHHRNIEGRVLSFHAYRITIRRRNGDVQTIDLKKGTVIRPIGVTPHEGDRISVKGYYSEGTFIAREITLR